MLTLAEYVAARAQLERLAVRTRDTTVEHIEGLSKDDAIIAAAKMGKAYYKDYNLLLVASMRETAYQSAKHYHKRTTIELEDFEIEGVVRRQLTEKYYGATLIDRLKYNQQLLLRRITTAGQQDVKNIPLVYFSPIGGGAQFSTDRMLLLGTLAKIEQDIAREVASKTEHKLVRWALSHRHKQPDVCDALATTVDKRVVAYINEHNLKMNPKGLFFIDDLPVPPHPNCQCEYGIVRGSEYIKPGTVERSLDRMRKLVRKIFRK